MYYSTSCLRALALLLSGKTGRAPNAICIVFNRFAVSLFQYGVDLTNNFPQWLRPLMDGQNTGSCWGLRVPSWRLRVSFENYPRLLVHKTGSDYHTKLWNHSKDWRVLGVCNTTVCFILKKKKKNPSKLWYVGLCTCIERFIDFVERSLSWFLFRSNEKTNQEKLSVFDPFNRNPEVEDTRYSLWQKTKKKSKRRRKREGKKVLRLAASTGVSVPHYDLIWALRTFVCANLTIPRWTCSGWELSQSMGHLHISMWCSCSCANRPQLVASACIVILGEITLRCFFFYYLIAIYCWQCFYTTL